MCGHSGVELRRGDDVGGKHRVGEGLLDEWTAGRLEGDSQWSSRYEGGSGQSGTMLGLGCLGYSMGGELRCGDGVFRHLLGFGSGAGAGEALLMMGAGRRRGGSGGSRSVSTMGVGSFVVSEEELGEGGGVGARAG